MAKSVSISPIFQISLFALGYLYLSSDIALAQVTSDGTVNTQVTQNDNVAEITGGQTRGDNLFHSFQDFSVSTGNEAAFLNSNDIANIFSRVTGGNISNIDGLISANGSANLFLINPAGILFGENARLDVGGSFYGSSASSILFEDGEFSATDLENPPVLTINAPIGLGFRDNPGDITVRRNGQGTRTTSDLIDTNNALRVEPNKTFALTGGNLLFEGATIKTAGGRIELGSVGGNQQVGLIPVNEGFSLDYAGVQNFQDIQLSQTATIDASGEGGGNIRVQGRNITLTDGSTIEASTLGSLPGGNLDITASETVELNGFNPSLIDTALINQVYSDATGIGGNITINTKNLNIIDGAEVSTNTFGAGNAGNITFNAFESINISSFLNLSDVFLNRVDAVYSLIDSGAATEATGNGGDFTINTPRFTVAGNVQLSSGTNGDGSAGNIFVKASEFVEIRDNPSTDTAYNTLIGTDVNTGAKGNGGNLTIETPRLSLTGKNARIVNGTSGKGDAGNIFIRTNQLIIEGGAGIQSLGFASSGNAGNIIIEASDFVSVGGIFTTIQAINENDTIVNTEANFGGIFASAFGGETGNSGNLTINTNKLIVQFGTISVGNFQTLNLVPPGKGAAGNIEINANSIEVDNGTISAETASGEGGNINLKIDDTLTMRNDSLITARAINEGKGGNISIDANFVVAFPSQLPKPNNGSDIIADGQEIGSSGFVNLFLKAFPFGLEIGQSLPGNETNDIDTFSESEKPEGISFRRFGFDVSSFSEKTFVEPEKTTEQVCQANRETAAQNGLTINGKGGIPATPDQPLTSQNLIINGETTSASAIPEPIETSQGKIQLARGIKVTNDGRVILTAYPTNNAGERIPEGRMNCGQI